MTFGEEFLKVSSLGEEARTDGNDRLTALVYLTVKHFEQLIHRTKSRRAVCHNYRVNLIETLVAIVNDRLKLLYRSSSENIDWI
jgi:hypothetical protein